MLRAALDNQINSLQLLPALAFNLFQQYIACTAGLPTANLTYHQAFEVYVLAYQVPHALWCVAGLLIINHLRVVITVDGDLDPIHSCQHKQLWLTSIPSILLHPFHVSLAVCTKGGCIYKGGSIKVT